MDSAIFDGTLHPFRAVSWRNIIFLPFIAGLKWTFVVAMYVSVLWNIYLFSFKLKPNFYTKFIFETVVETYFFIYTLLLFMHRILKTHRRQRMFEPHPTILLLLDVISLTPLTTFLSVLNRHSRTILFSDDTVAYTNCYFKLLRVGHLFYFYMNLRGDLRNNPTLMILIGQFLLSWGIIASFSALYYYIGDRPSLGANTTWKSRWMSTGLDPNRWDYINTSNIHNWVFIATYDINSMFFNNAQRVMIEQSRYDLILTFATMCIGFFSLYTFVGIIITEELTTMRKRFNLQSRLNEALKLMKTLNMPEHYQRKVKKYYEMIWNNRMGYVNIPQAIQLITPYMQMQVYDNIYHEALLHSHIFSKISKVYRSMISTAMTTQVYLPGDFILNENDMKSKFMFIESGRVEITRAHGENIRVVVTDGTLLGAISCIRPTISNSNIKCLTHCTLHVMEHAAMLRILLQSRIELQKLRRLVDENIKFAQRKREQLGAHPRGSHLKFVKTQWNNIVDNPDATFDEKYTSKYLNYITLVRNEVHSDAFCLMGKCPFILRRGTMLQKILEYLELSCILLNFFCSYEDIFYQRITYERYTFYCMIDSLMIFNIFIQMITTEMPFENNISTFSSMFFTKMKSWCFIIDVIATLPYDYILMIISSSSQLVSIARVPRWILLYKVWKFIISKEKSLSKYYMYLIIIKYFTVYLFVTLVLAYAFQVLACFDRVCSPLTWLNDDKSWFMVKFGYYIPPNKMLNSLNFILNTFMRLNLRIYNDHSIAVIYLRNVIRIAAYYAVTMHLAQFSALFSLRFERYQLYAEYLQNLRIYIRDHKELKQLRDTLMEYMTMKWMISNTISFRDLSRVTCSTDAENDPEDSEYIRRNVKNDYIISILKKTKFFQNMSEDFVYNLSNKCDMFIVPEGHRIVEAGQNCFYLYVIVYGYCTVQSRTPSDIEKNMLEYYSNYAVVPLVEYLHQVECFLDVFTATAVQLLSIPYATFVSCLYRFPNDKNRIASVLKEHKALNRSVLECFAKSSDVEKKPLEVNMYVPKFEYEARAQKIILTTKNVKPHSYKRSLFRAYRNQLRKITLSTYSPNSTSYMAYEVFRCIWIIIQTNLQYMSIMKSYHANPYVQAILFVADFFWIIDLIVKAHLEYYDEHGRSVKGLRKTTKHYATSSFAFDFLGGVPIDFKMLFFYVKPKDQIRAMQLTAITLRMFLWIRPTFLFVYVIKLNKFGITLFLKCLALVLAYYHLAMQLACYKLLITCDILQDLQFVCPNDSWISMSKIQFTKKGDDYFWISVCSIFGVCVEPTDRIMPNMDILIVLLTGLIMTLMRLTIICAAVGEGCIRGTNLIFHQDRVLRYLKFFRKRFVSNSTKNSTVAHFDYLWRKCHSESSPSVFDNVYPFLRELLITTMYRKAIRNCILFQGDHEQIFRRFVPYIKQRYYNKDAIIIRTNDIQDKLYLVTNGEVEILVANTRVALLAPGAIFGSFEVAGLCRQLIVARATQNVSLITMRSTRFYQVIKGVPSLERTMRNLRRQQLQFASRDQMSHHASSTYVSVMSKRTLITGGHAIRVIGWHAYIVNIHLAPINALLVLVNLSVEFGVHNFLALYVILDLIFYMVFLYRANVRTLDKKTGNEITNLRSLRVHYFKSLLFFVDVTSGLPLYLMRVWFFQDIIQIVFTFNKLFRLYYIYYHHYHNYGRNCVPKHLNWTLLIYVIIFLFHTIYDYGFIVKGLPYKKYMSFMSLGYLYVMNIISTTGFNIVRQHRNVLEMFAITVAFLLSFVITIILIRLYTRSVYMMIAYTCYYRQRAQNFMRFCRMLHICQELTENIWSYLYYLRLTQGGVQFPWLYVSMPRYLKQDHMQSLYGKLISSHSMFFDLHIDFLKQVQTRIKCVYYLPGSTIVEKSYFDNNIHFIVDGRVVAIRHKTESDFVVANTYEILEAGATFGEFEALLHCEYTRTYQTLTPVHLISIPIHEFTRLLNWFPASKQKIEMRMSDYKEGIVR